MGTRGIWGFRKNGIDKFQYNQFDTYPNGLGKEIIELLQNTSIGNLNKICDEIIIVSEEIPPTDEQIKECYEFLNTTVSTGDPKEWYCLLREAQGNPNAYKDGLKYMEEAGDFIKDSLFCEYGYVINLDENKFEYWKGYQKKPQKGNRYGEKSEDGYYPCKLALSIHLSDIQDNVIKTDDLIQKMEGCNE